MKRSQRRSFSEDISIASTNPLDSEYRLPATLVQAFQREGHVLVPDLASRDEVDAWRPVVERVVGKVARSSDSQGRIDDYSRLFTQVTNIWRLDDEARRIVFAKRFARLAARLLGASSVRLYHDQALFKPAGGERTPWHQDRYYWPLGTDSTVTMWLPLSDVTAEMGPMRFACGSHRESGLGDLSISPETDARLASLIGERQWPCCTSSLRAGDATFHLGGTLHSTGANHSPTTRAVLTVIYFADGTRVVPPANEYQRADLAVFLPGIRPGDLAASELNPVLYP